MTQRVYKYYPRPDVSEIEMPKDAAVLSVAMKDDVVTLWALVEPEAPKEMRKFLVVETDEPIGDFDNLDLVLGFVGTVISRDGYVLHVFDMGPCE